MSHGERESNKLCRVDSYEQNMEDPQTNLLGRKPAIAHLSSCNTHLYTSYLVHYSNLHVLQIEQSFPLEQNQYQYSDNW
jgi:hypothetical protein